jgi:hypothetical protein
LGEKQTDWGARVKVLMLSTDADLEKARAHLKKKGWSHDPRRPLTSCRISVTPRQKACCMQRGAEWHERFTRLEE